MRNFRALLVVLLCLTLPWQAWALTPEKPLPDLEDGDTLRAAWLVGTFDVLYDWAQGASTSLDVLDASMAAEISRTNAVSASASAAIASVSAVFSRVTALDASMALVLASSSDVSAFNALEARSDGHTASSTGVHGLGAGVAVDGASNSAVLTNKTLSTGCVWNGGVISNAYLNASASVVANAVVLRDGSGNIAGISGSGNATTTVVITCRTAAASVPTGNVPDGYNYEIPFDTETADSLGEMNGSTFTAQVSGNYQISGAVGFAASGSRMRTARVFVNGTPSWCNVMATADGVYGNALPFCYSAHLNAGDKVTIVANQNSDNSVDLSATYLCIHRLN